MRKLKLLFAALALLVGGAGPASADTALLTAGDGWTKITEMPADVSLYYFTIVDNSQDLMLTLSRGKEQGGDYNGLFYGTSANPLVDKSKLFSLETDGGKYVMRNVEYNGYFLQTEWNDAQKSRTHDNGGGSKEWGRIKFTYADGMWTIQNGKYEVDNDNYMGVWADESPANGKDIALNKGAGAKGTFQIYAILKTTVDAYYAALTAGKNLGATPSNPVDMTGLIVNPNARFWTGSIPFGWTTTGTQNVNTGNGYDGFPGIFEFSNWNASNWTGSLKQTITVPNGKYKLKAAFMAATGVTVHLTANEDKSDDLAPIGDNGGNINADGTETTMGSGQRGFKYLTVETTVTTGSLEIGTYGEASAEHLWVNADNFTLSYLDPCVSVISDDMASTGGAMAADQWYKFTVATDGDYNFSPIANIVISDNGNQLLSTATGDALTATKALTSGITYYVKSTSAQTLTIAPASYTYVVGEATADVTYIQQGNTVTVSYDDLATNSGASPTIDFSGVKFGGNAIAVTPTADGFTFTVPAVTANTDYTLAIPANAIGYAAGSTYNVAQEITLKTPDVFDGTYYLYDATNKVFLARGGASGTRAVVDKYGVPFTLTTNDANASLIEFEDWTGVNMFFDKNNHADCWIFTDGGSGQGDNRLFAFEKTTGGYYLRDAAKDVYIKHDNSVLTVPTTTEGEAAVWTVLTPAERNAILAAYPTDNYQNIIDAASLSTTSASFVTYLSSNFAAKDKTSSVNNAKITDAAGSWTWTSVRGQDGQPAYNNAAEAWVATGSWSQEISGLDQGIYKVTINAFERRANNATSYALGEAGFGTVTSSYLKANNEQVRIKSWYEEVVKDGDNYNPNSMSQAVTAFNNDKFKSEVYTYVGSDGKLTLTIAKPNYVWDCWLLWDNVTLTYYDNSVSNEEATAIIAEATAEMAKPMKPSLYQALSSAKATFEGAQNIANYNALRTAIDNTATSVASYAAMNTNYLKPIAALLASSNIIDQTSSAYIDYVATKAKYDNYTDAQTADIENVDANALTLWQGNGATYTNIGNILMSTGWKKDGNDALTDGSGFYANTWSTENAGTAPAKDFARPFYEMWVSSGSIAAATLTRTITGMTANAYYSVSANVRVQYDSKVDGSITMKAGSGVAVDVTAGSKIGDTKRYIGAYTAYGQADGDGKLTITFTVAENSGITWLAFRDVNVAAAEVAEASDYAALNTAISGAEAKTLGFEDGEYAPYNNVAAIQALAAAKAIDQTATNLKTSVTSATNDLTGATWTANADEVNAVYNGDFALSTNDGAMAGWVTDHSAGLGTAYHARAFVLTSGGNYDNLAAFGQGDGTRSCAYFRFDGTNSAKTTKYTYGITNGYTMPLKTNTIYKLTAKVGGWGQVDKNFQIAVVKSNDENLIAQSLKTPTTGVNAGGSVIDYEMYFVVPAAGNYKLVFSNASSDADNAVVVSNIELKSTGALVFANGSVPTYAPGTYPTVKITRTLTAGNWATAIYPFAVSGVDNIAVLKSYDKSTGALGFISAAASTANVPFLMKSATDKSEISLTDVVVAAANATDATDATDGKASLKGVYASTDITNAEKNYVLSNNKIYSVGTAGATIPAYRAYIQIDQSTPAPLFFTVDGETTGINMVQGEGSKVNGEVYDLQGRKVAKPAKGMYIQNGRKVMIK